MKDIKAWRIGGSTNFYWSHRGWFCTVVFFLSEIRESNAAIVYKYVVIITSTNLPRLYSSYSNHQNNHGSSRCQYRYEIPRIYPWFPCCGSTMVLLACFTIPVPYRENLGMTKIRIVYRKVPKFLPVPWYRSVAPKITTPWIAEHNFSARLFLQANMRSSMLVFKIV